MVKRWFIIDVSFDLQAALEERTLDLIAAKDSRTITEHHFMGVWDILCILVLAQIETCINGSKHTKDGYTADEAVIYGYLVRVFDLVSEQRRCIVSNIKVTETIYILGRCIMESNATLQYLIQNYNPVTLQDFRMYGLKEDAEFEAIVLADIANKGGNFTEFENGILQSIRSEYEKIHTTGEDVLNWKLTDKKLSNIKEKFVTAGNDRLYAIAYKGGSHSIHGKWCDLSKNYLSYDKEADRFHPDFIDYFVDIRSLNPELFICCQTLQLFYNTLQGHELDSDMLSSIQIIKEAVIWLEEQHMEYRSMRI